MAAEKKRLPISIFELVVYVLSGLMAIWGIVYISLGIACNFAKYDSGLIAVDAGLKNNTNGMGFLEQGILVLAIGVIVAVIFLLVNAKKADRIYEKEQRRKAARFNRGKRLSEEETTIVEAEVAE